MTPLIDVRDLNFRYDDGTHALKGIDFQLFPGETVALFGPNGSGKTTFVLHLNGLLTGQGSIEICGMRLAKDTVARIRRKIGLVFQDSETQLFMPTVLEDVAFGLLNAGMDGRAAEQRAIAALERTGMADAIGRAPYHLSAGEKKRVAIAGILAMEPEILILDEPTTYLDPPGHTSLVEFLRSLPQAKLIVTHDTGFAETLARRACFFERGRIAGTGTVRDIIRRFAWDRVPAAPGPASDTERR
jgi:energy-coupling factor transporter ATP-binding protein EcfA2